MYRCFLQIDTNVFNKHALLQGYLWLPQNGCYRNENSLWKAKSKIIQYINYKHFHEQSFNFELNNELLKIDINNADLKEFNDIF